MSEPVFPVRIVVPFDVMRLSPNLRLHPAERRKRQRDSALAARYAYRKAGSVEWGEPVIVDLVIRRGRKVDNDNAIASCKWAADQLFQRERWGWGIVPDDSADWVTWGTVTQETGRVWRGNEEVEFIVRPRQEE